MSNLDLGAAFDKWVDDTFLSYHGVLLERVKGGYKCMGIFCLNLQDVDRVIDSGRAALQNSINKTHKNV